MSYRNALVLLIISWTTALSAEEPVTGPVIDGYGPNYFVNERDVPLPEGFVYKTVFDIGQDPKPVDGAQRDSQG